MKKLITLSIMIVMFVSKGNSQTYYSQPFTGATMPAGFTQWDNDHQTLTSTLTGAGWTNTPWMIRPVGAGADHWVASPCDFVVTTGSADRWLITPRITIPGGSQNVALQFDAEGYYGYPATYEVRISTTDTNTASFTTVVYSNNQENPYFTTRAVSLQQYAGQFIYVAFRNITPTNQGYAMAIDNIKVYSAPSYDVTTADVEMYEHNYLTHAAPVTGIFSNLGFDTLRSFNINYSVNGGAPVVQPISGVTIPGLGTGQYIYTHPTAFNPATAGTYKVKVWFDNLNGANVDAVHSNDTASSTNLFFYPQVAGLVKKALVEEYTGVGCPYCADGAIKLRNLVANNPDVIAVAVHDSTINDLNTSPADRLQIPDGYALSQTYTIGYPSASVDRLYFFDNQSVGLNRTDNTGATLTWDTASAFRLTQASPVNVTFANPVFDNNNNTLTVDVNANFLNSLSTGNYRINLYVIEDSVNTTGPGYDQANAYNNDNTSVLYGLGNPIINNGTPNHWSHQHVLRLMGGGPWGSAGVIPSNPAASTTYTKTFTVNIDPSWRTHFLSYVGVVQEYNANDPTQRLVLNSAEAKFSSIIGIKENSQFNKLGVYPNPASTMAVVEMDIKESGTISVSIVNTLGETVVEPSSTLVSPGIQTVKLPVNSLADGLYFVKVSINGETNALPLSIAK